MPEGTPARHDWNDASLEREARADLEQPLLAALEVAGELRGLAEQGRRLSGDVRPGVGGVGQVEALGDDLEGRTPSEPELLGDAEVELLEVGPAAGVEGRHPRRQVTVRAVAVVVDAGEDV